MTHLRFNTLCVIVLAGVCIDPLPVYAHKLLLNARSSADRLHVEVFFDDDTPAQQAKITLENDRHEIVHEGKTDERGVWSCPAPPAGAYVLKALTAGHNAKKALTFSMNPENVNSSSASENLKTSSRAIYLEDDRTPLTQRTEETGFPYLPVTLGLGIIGLLTSIFWMARRGRKLPGNDAPLQ